MLRKLEALTFFFAMLLAIVLEGEVVYWMFGCQPVPATSGGSLKVVGDWTGPALPQGWLLGAMLVLIYRVVAMFIPPADWTDGEWLHNRQAFVRLWGLAIALVTIQSFLVCIGNPAAS